MSTKKSPTNKSSKSKDRQPNSISKSFLSFPFYSTLFAGQMNEDVDKMDFETKMRQLMRELLEPLIYKSKVDREMIFKLEKTDTDYEKRIDLLEQAVYNKNAETGTTMFDDMEKKLQDMDILLKSTTTSFAEQVEFTEKKTMDEIFRTNQELFKIKNYSESIELNKKSIENLQFIVESTV
jgi:hypothetical protein